MELHKERRWRVGVRVGLGAVGKRAESQDLGVPGPSLALPFPAMNINT